ncbi:Uma2 family endonuclease [uncultured Thiodictyon sp.]|uniref:Uma2 family endonuclease n=1 Tax=uncultured Thiodictyon sp. TaxID=1846217 RepID=UPI0025DDB1F5|nr:Uma2 family endonuclease [uncultured Thiodictyon sp.]
MHLLDTNVISEARKAAKADPGVRRFFAQAKTTRSPLYLSAIALGEVRRGLELIRHRADESTEAYDRGARFACYRQLPTLEEYVLIDSRTRSVEVFRRHPEGWMLQQVPEEGRLTLDAIGFDCGLDAIYEDARFAAPTDRFA